MKKLKACILAAGKGTRLVPLTETRPKPIIPIAGKPLLQHTIEILRENKIDDILIIDGYLKEQIQEYFKNGKKFNVNISYIEQKSYQGTAHAANLAKEFVGDNPFILLYGDLFMDNDYQLWRIHERLEFQNTLFFDCGVFMCNNGRTFRTPCF